MADAALYRWAGVRAHSGSPSVRELVEAGWTPVAHDTRYGSTLCRKEVNASAHATGRAVRDEPPTRPAEPGMRRKEVPLPLCAAILAVLVLLDSAAVAVAAWEHLETRAAHDGIEMSR